MKKAVTLVLFLALFSVAKNSYSTENVSQITAEELNKMIEDKADFILIDARPEQMFKQEHITGAISLPADKVDAQTLAKLSDNMEKKLVFYCADTHCPASRIAAAKAFGAGYKYVYEYLGGIAQWKEVGYKTAPQPK